MSDIVISALVQALVLSPLAVMLALVWRRRCGGMAIAVGVIYLLAVLFLFRPSGLLTPAESLIIPEENMRLVEQKAGLVRLQHALQTDTDAAAITALFPHRTSLGTGLSGQKTIYWGISRFPLGRLSYFPQKILPAEDADMVRWSDHLTFDIDPGRAAHHAHMWHGRLCLWAVVAAANLLILSGVRLCGGRLRPMAAATLILLPLAFFWGYDRNYFNWRDGAAPALSNVAAGRERSEIDSLLSATRIMTADASDNVWRREMLLGGRDFFASPFLSCKTGAFSYWYYFPEGGAPESFFSSFAKVEAPGKGIYLVAYPDFTANFYISLAGWLGCLAVTFWAAVMWLRRLIH